MRQSIALVTFLTFSFAVEARQVHDVPFASSKNAIELTVSNATSIRTSDITIEAKNIPTGLKFSNTLQRIDRLHAHQERSVVFVFSVDKTAPVNQTQSIHFSVTNSSGESWTKEIRIRMKPPEQFELFQNYPNPFNPSTTIGYQLPKTAMVSLRVYDLLGREVGTLVDGQQDAGFHQMTLNAAHLSSGAYIYQLLSVEEHGERQILRRMMLILK